MSDGPNGVAEPEKPQVVFAVHREASGGLAVQSTLAPPQLVQLLLSLTEDARYQAFKMREQEEKSRVQLFGNMPDVLKVPR
jgi:hypothetical protein